MKTILVLISIMIFGLYSCGDESTNPTPNPTEETKKYTLEEILADSNWVEITDTLHYHKLSGITQSPTSTLKDSTLFIVTNVNEFQNLKQYYDSLYLHFEPNDFIFNIDFEQHDLLIAKTKYYSFKMIDKMFFVNHKIKEYYYFININRPLEGGIMKYYRDGNMLLVPKLYKNYKVGLSILDGGFKSVHDYN